MRQAAFTLIQLVTYVQNLFLSFNFAKVKKDVWYMKEKIDVLPDIRNRCSIKFYNLFSITTDDCLLIIGCFKYTS